MGWVAVLRLSSTAAALPDRWQLVGHINNYAWALMSCGGQASESAEVATEGYRLAEEVGNPRRRGWQCSSPQWPGETWAGSTTHCGPTARHTKLSDRAGNHIGYLWQSVAYAYNLQMADRYDEAIDKCRQDAGRGGSFQKRKLREHLARR
ncbi:hypothetical protein HDA40_002434 [Hamadaea flava]|uniref:hypothetical protein n=1 Tax=Hamadaea flava TaxID=1742688 RepID=UPI0036D306AB|nr:hypothetical protein [Hamadaea flava]